jgi:hypothetical protein
VAPPATPPQLHEQLEERDKETLEPVPVSGPPGESDGFYDAEERRLLPLFIKRMSEGEDGHEEESGGSRKALRVLGIA